MRIATPALALLAFSAPAVAQEQVSLFPIRDTTIYEESGALSNGAGSYLFSGTTGAAGGGSERRALVAFDVSALPVSATITGAELTLHLSRTISGDQPVTLHRVVRAWGEGSSNADANEGRGAAATSGDATWSDRFFPTLVWDAPGGEYVESPSASTPVGGFGFYRWSSSGIVSDVQEWVDGRAENHGWILLGGTGLGTAKRFDSRENPTEAFRPVLTVTFADGTAVEDMPAAAVPTLDPNWPNPFGYRTEMKFTLPSATRVSLEVFDLLGRRVATLVDDRLPAGTHSAAFHAVREPAGIYLARLRAGGRVLVRQMAHVD